LFGNFISTVLYSSIGSRCSKPPNVAPFPAAIRRQQNTKPYFPAIVRYAGARLLATIKMAATAEPIPNAHRITQLVRTKLRRNGVLNRQLTAMD